MYQKVVRGNKFVPNAALHNDTVDAVKFVKRLRGGEIGTAPYAVGATVLRGLNTSGSDIKAFEAVKVDWNINTQVDASGSTPGFMNNPCVKIQPCDHTVDAPRYIGIAQDKIPQDGTGLIVVSGLSFVVVESGFTYPSGVAGDYEWCRFTGVGATPSLEGAHYIYGLPVNSAGTDVPSYLYVNINARERVNYCTFSLDSALTTTDQYQDATVIDSWPVDIGTASIRVKNKPTSGNYQYEGDAGDIGTAVLVYSEVNSGKDVYLIQDMECP